MLTNLINTSFRRGQYPSAWKLANDLSNVPRNCSTECYVDDTKIYISFNLKDCDDAVAAVNEDLHNIRNWCFQNGLLLNPEKTKLIVYGSRQMFGQRTSTC